MKASELRLGNWYDFDGLPYQWGLVDFKNMEFEDKYIGEPIELNEQWLERFGFQRFKGWMVKDAWSPGHPSQRFDLYWSEQDGFMCKSRYQEDRPHFFMRHIKYVHSLQNLFHSLTGEELIIKENTKLPEVDTEKVFKSSEGT